MVSDQKANKDAWWILAKKSGYIVEGSYKDKLTAERCLVAQERPDEWEVVRVIRGNSSETPYEEKTDLEQAAELLSRWRVNYYRQSGEYSQLVDNWLNKYVDIGKGE